MKKLIIFMGLMVGLAAAAGPLYLIFSGPRMKDQQSVRAYEQPTLAVPGGAVPVARTLGLDERIAALTVLRSPATAENLTAGGKYYGYYCVFCHGRAGQGRAQVGDGYVPSPGSLTTARVRGMNDAELIRAMLTGKGHEPVLGRIVPAKAWPALVLHVRTLAGLGGG